MRKSVRRLEPSFIAAIDDDAGELAPSTRRRSRKDIIACIGAIIGAIAIATNALFLQKGPHPAPIFADRRVATVSSNSVRSVLLPRPRPLDPEPGGETVAVPRTRQDVIADIQKELARRGFYDGPADGVHGPKTDAAMRDFEQAAGLKPGGEANELFLRAMARSSVKAAPATPDAPRPPDPIGDLIVPSKRVMAVQRALTDFGYGQIKPSGLLDSTTQEAIQRFERARKLPITGQISPRLIRELAALTGRPLE